MHGTNVEFSNLIPGKLCFRREIFAILRENINLDVFFCLFLTKMSEKLLQIFDAICDHIPRKVCILSSLELSSYLVLAEGMSTHQVLSQSTHLQDIIIWFNAITIMCMDLFDGLLHEIRRVLVRIRLDHFGLFLYAG